MADMGWTCGRPQMVDRLWVRCMQAAAMRLRRDEPEFVAKRDAMAIREFWNLCPPREDW